MKNIKRILLVISLVALVVATESCKPDDPEPETERVKNILKSASWKMQSVTVDGIDQTGVYKGLVLNFSETGFTSTQGGTVWPATGTWRFPDETATSILRNDGTLITVNEVTDTQIVLALTWAQTSLGGRSESVKGLNVFTFVK